MNEPKPFEGPFRRGEKIGTTEADRTKSRIADLERQLRDEKGITDTAIREMERVEAQLREAQEWNKRLVSESEGMPEETAAQLQEARGKGVALFYEAKGWTRAWRAAHDRAEEERALTQELQAQLQESEAARDTAEAGVNAAQKLALDLYQRRAQRAEAAQEGMRVVLQLWMDTLIVLDNQPKRTDLIELKMQTHRVLSSPGTGLQAALKAGYEALREAGHDAGPVPKNPRFECHGCTALKLLEPYIGGSDD